ncbi:MULTISPECIES: hypothetical protein [unclassified Bradyrhizobium]|uniref:hypothetical protein n=1 Tax=unclassified Bradyrhizobium TaxID=2631580 RepID=UPI001CD80CD4|nr:MULTISPECIES: hypothetical protein [unclassified Bradyrhizobium]MCA1384360.1 hypothetical protein [Bradyrhizobium sp. BRP05]MCA1392773.1 hypothetical protein [Bradyrhizobium sp. IC3123]MCA1421100.1 hypothetical protein [Bradyrhizobium sp. BRP23]MCA1428470.1 hypothetical protein [Bradyrhizobium sp. NBAIM16]MCA1479313.1 hypothetical protein [Bradyrhizobium sp. NBAIM08]
MSVAEFIVPRRDAFPTKINYPAARIETGILIFPAWLTLVGSSTMLKRHDALMATED